MDWGLGMGDINLHPLGRRSLRLPLRLPRLLTCARLVKGKQRSLSVTLRVPDSTHWSGARSGTRTVLVKSMQGTLW